MPAMSDPNSLPASTAPRRSRDVRWRALLLTVLLIVAGGATLEFWDRLPGFGAPSAASQHARQKRATEIEERFQQGVVMLHARQYDHALTAFHRVIELAPNLPEAYANAGFALLGKQEFKAAADFFDEATTLNRDQLNAYYGLAVALDSLGDRRLAIEAMQVYLHRAPADDPFRRKAEAAIWEWRETSPQPGNTPPPR